MFLKAYFRVDNLNREIQVARDNLLKSSSDGPLALPKPLPSSRQLLDSPGASRVKLRRATVAIPERKEKKPLKTYSSKASQDDSGIHRSDQNVQNHSSLRSKTSTSSFNEDGFGESTGWVTRDGPNSLPSKEHKMGHDAYSDTRRILQQECAHNNSTVSTSTATMTRVGSLSNVTDSIPRQSDGSTMPLTPDETITLHDSFVTLTASKLPYSSEDPVLFSTLSKKDSVPAEEVFSPDPINSKSKKRPRVLLELPDPCAAEKKVTSDHHDTSPTKRARIHRSEESGNQSDQDDTCDELSLSLLKENPSNITSKQSNTNRPRERDELDDDKLGSDDIGIDLPVEKYQPRPSRSRSGRANEELLVPIDFSKRPEAIAKGKKKNKRRKTTAFEQLVHEDKDERDIFQVKIPSPSKGSEPFPVGLKLRDIPMNLNTEVTKGPQAETDASKEVSKAPPTKKRGRPKKQVQEPHEEQVKPACDPAPSPTKSRITVPNQSTSKKRKLPTNLDPDLSCAEEDGALPPETNPNIPDSPPPPLSARPSPSRNKDPPITRSPSPTTKHLSSALQTPPKTVPAKGPDKHSPISSGKVAYRVGLSKRARIEPLLRIMRK